MIKNIVFDFGGVLLDLNYELSFEALSSLMGRRLDKEHMPQQLSDVFLDYEKGLIQSETFMWNIQKYADRQIQEPHKIIQAWNAMLLGWNPDRLPWLLELRKTYRTFILSNTNELHIGWVRKDLQTQHGVEHFEDTYFEHVYYSHDMGMRKPDSNIYETVLQQSDLRASETLFIDDTLANVVAAQSVGIHAVQHDATTEIINMLPSYIMAAEESATVQ